MPVGFWADLVAAVRTELKPPVFGFFVPNPDGPVGYTLQGDTLILRCNGSFVCKEVDNPAVLQLVGRKASAKLGRPIKVRAVDVTQVQQNSGKMDALLTFGRAHSDVIKIKE